MSYKLFSNSNGITLPEYGMKGLVMYNVYDLVTEVNFLVLTYNLLSFLLCLSTKWLSDHKQVCKMNLVMSAPIALNDFLIKKGDNIRDST